MEAGLEYTKELRISDLAGCATDIYDFAHGLRGIRNTAERAGDEELMAKAALWIAAAEALCDSINDALTREKGPNA